MTAFHDNITANNNNNNSLGVSLGQKGRQYSVESTKTLKSIADLKTSFESIVRQVEQIEKSTDVSDYISVARSKSALAQLIGSIEKLQFNKLDAITTGHLDSGKAEAKANRRELNVAMDKLQEVVSSLYQKYCAASPPPTPRKNVGDDCGRDGDGVVDSDTESSDDEESDVADSDGDVSDEEDEHDIGHDNSVEDTDRTSSECDNATHHIFQKPPIPIRLSQSASSHPLFGGRGYSTPSQQAAHDARLQEREQRQALLERERTMAAAKRQQEHEALHERRRAMAARRQQELLREQQLQKQREMLYQKQLLERQRRQQFNDSHYYYQTPRMRMGNRSPFGGFYF